jgi:hypothetical protein
LSREALIRSSRSDVRPVTLTAYVKARSLADLPVQATSKYETVISLRTGTALGLDVLSTLLARAHEVIE